MLERRKASERRRKPTPFFNRYLFRGRRTGHRRSEDLQRSVYVHRFQAVEWSAISLLLFLCAAGIAVNVIVTFDYLLPNLLEISESDDIGH
jgi:hypothetical protein